MSPSTWTIRIESIASSGFDAIWLCLEHRRIDPALMYSLIQACRLGGADALRGDGIAVNAVVAFDGH